jgi:hypothetical protein
MHMHCDMYIWIQFWIVQLLIIEEGSSLTQWQNTSYQLGWLLPFISSLVEVLTFPFPHWSFPCILLRDAQWQRHKLVFTSHTHTPLKKVTWHNLKRGLKLFYMDKITFLICSLFCALIRCLNFIRKYQKIHLDVWIHKSQWLCWPF